MVGFRDALTSVVAGASRPRPLFGFDCSTADRQLSAKGSLALGKTSIGLADAPRRAVRRLARMLRSTPDAR